MVLRLLDHQSGFYLYLQHFFCAGAVSAGAGAGSAGAGSAGAGSAGAGFF